MEEARRAQTRAQTRGKRDRSPERDDASDTPVAESEAEEDMTDCRRSPGGAGKGAGGARRSPSAPDAGPTSCRARRGEASPRPARNSPLRRAGAQRDSGCTCTTTRRSRAQSSPRRGAGGRSRIR
jgi:hypothetical protein